MTKIEIVLAGETSVVELKVSTVSGRPQRLVQGTDGWQFSYDDGVFGEPLGPAVLADVLAQMIQVGGCLRARTSTGWLIWPAHAVPAIQLDYDQGPAWARRPDLE